MRIRHPGIVVGYVVFCLVILLITASPALAAYFGSQPQHPTHWTPIIEYLAITGTAEVILLAFGLWELLEDDSRP